MIVSAVPEANPPYALVEGIQSGRALSTFIRAVMRRHGFDRYDYLMVDLNSFGEWSPWAVDELAAAARTAADAGHWLVFFPVAPRWMCGAGDDRFQGFPDRAHAHRAMQQHWFARGRVSVARKPLVLTPGSWRGTASQRVPWLKQRLPERHTKGR